MAYYGNPQQTTPSEITPRLSAFATDLKAQAPVYVEVRPESWARKGYCHMNVARYCSENEGATAVNGYILWACDHYADAEYHAGVPAATVRGYVVFAESILQHFWTEADGVVADVTIDQMGKRLPRILLQSVPETRRRSKRDGRYFTDLREALRFAFGE